MPDAQAVSRTWLVVEPGAAPRPVVLPEGDLEARRALVGGKMDSGRLSHHWHVFVYEWSAVNGSPLNWFVVHETGTAYPLHGTVLVYKTDDMGSTVDITSHDLANFTVYVVAARRHAGDLAKVPISDYLD